MVLSNRILFNLERAQIGIHARQLEQKGTTMEKKGEVVIEASLEEILLAAHKPVKEGNGNPSEFFGKHEDFLKTVESTFADKHGKEWTMSAVDNGPNQRSELIFEHGELFRRFGKLSYEAKYGIVLGVRAAMKQEKCGIVTFPIPWSESSTKQLRVRCTGPSNDPREINIMGDLRFSIKE